MTNVTLCIYRDHLDPTQISARLGLKPTDSFRRGEPIVTKRRRYSDHPTGGWLLSSRDRVPSEELEVHLAWLLQQIEPAAEVIRARIANLKVPVDFDIYS